MPAIHALILLLHPLLCRRCEDAALPRATGANLIAKEPNHLGGCKVGDRNLSGIALRINRAGQGIAVILKLEPVGGRSKAAINDKRRQSRRCSKLRSQKQACNCKQNSFSYSFFSCISNLYKV